jgi:hypothetical protein
MISDKYLLYILENDMKKIENKIGLIAEIEEKFICK